MLFRSLEAPTRKKFREELLKNCYIFSIVSLTKFAFAPYTKEKTYILFMQKKERGEIQTTPIWHFILDYDGFANSDKRYRTKYHDDLPELEEKFDRAVRLLKIFLTDKNKFEQERSNFERKINDREKSEGLWGMKYGYVRMENVNEDNFRNLLSEYHLRPYQLKRIKEKKFDEHLTKIKFEIKGLLK